MRTFNFNVDGSTKSIVAADKRDLFQKVSAYVTEQTLADMPIPEDLEGCSPADINEYCGELWDRSVAESSRAAAPAGSIVVTTIVETKQSLTGAAE
jgi:hypothetical protein